MLRYAGLDHGGDVADVMTIAVAPSAQGRGLGRRLLDELETRARAAGAGGIRHARGAGADNAAAIGLYDRAGYTVVSTRRRYYQPGDIDALVMQDPVRRGGWR